MCANLFCCACVGFGTDLQVTCCVVVRVLIYEGVRRPSSPRTVMEIPEEILETVVTSFPISFSFTVLGILSIHSLDNYGPISANFLMRHYPLQNILHSRTQNLFYKSSSFC